MSEEIHAICQECGNQFDYILKPGYPRKYCNTCKEIKKQAYEDRQPVPVEKPGVVNMGRAMGKTPMPTLPIENKHLTMYVSYAKDIFCAIISDDRVRDEKGLREVMKTATDLVKQAMKELS